MRTRIGQSKSADKGDDGVFEQMLEALGVDYNAAIYGPRKMLCLFHNESQPSMSMDPQEGWWKCHSCGSKGHDAIAFLKEYEGLDFPAAKKRLAELTGHELKGGGSGGAKEPKRVKSGGFRPAFRL